MILYVESNFVLEVALGQEQSQATEEILLLAEQGRIELAIPSFAFSEPFATITHRTRHGERLSRTLADHFRQLFRSQPHRGALEGFESVPQALIKVHKREMDLLESTVRRLLASASVLPLSLASFQEGLDLERRLGLSPQDSIIYACVLADLARRNSNEPKCFVSRNYKDFGDPDIESQLGSLGCRYIDSYTKALDFAKERLR